MPRQERVDDRALDADPTSVDQPDLTESSLVYRRQELLHDRRDVARRERVQVQCILDRDPNRFHPPQIFGPVITCFCQWS